MWITPGSDSDIGFESLSKYNMRGIGWLGGQAADHLAPLTNGVSGLTSAQVPIIALTATATHQVCKPRG